MVIVVLTKATLILSQIDILAETSYTTEEINN